MEDLDKQTKRLDRMMKKPLDDAEVTIDKKKGVVSFETPPKKGGIIRVEGSYPVHLNPTSIEEFFARALNDDTPNPRRPKGPYKKRPKKSR